MPLGKVDPISGGCNGMGDDGVYEYVKEIVDGWRAEEKSVVTVDDVLTNLSLMECDHCGGTGKVSKGGQSTDCPICGERFADGLKTFRFVGNIVSMEEKTYSKKTGVPPTEHYQRRAKSDGAPTRNGKVREERRTAYCFVVDDGENSISCIVHNFKYIYPNGFEDMELPDVVRILRDAYSKGTRVVLYGKPFPFKETRFKEVPYIFVESVEADKSDFQSKLDVDEIEKFLLRCKESTDYPTLKPGLEATPLDVARVEIWQKMVVPKHIKDAMMLWCISPVKHQEQLHIALITDPGEGKDYMHKNVLSPVARLGVAGSRLTTSIPSLIGAMSSSNLNKVSLGLLPRYHHARVVVTEFSTWDEEMWSALLGVMSEGEIVLGKGEISGRRRPACLNLLLLGNPPKRYDEDIHPKMETMKTFGDYTYAMISRCALIFVENKLTEDDEQVRQKMVENIDRDTGGRVEPRLEYFREFFCEYFKFVSSLRCPISPQKPACDFIFNEISKQPSFSDFLTTKGRPDKRKYLQFLNLVKFYAKANGRVARDSDGDLFIRVQPLDVNFAGELFRKSAVSLADNFDTSLLDLEVKDQRILRYIIENPGSTMSQIRKDLGLVGDSKDSFVLDSFRTLEELGKIQNIDGAYIADTTEAVTLTKREESTPAVSPSSNSSTGSDIFSRRIDFLMRKFGLGEDMGELVSDVYNTFPGSLAHFRRVVERETRGQISVDEAEKMYRAFKERGL